MYKTSNRPRTTPTPGTKLMDVPNIRSCIGRKAYSYKGPAFWNTLDSQPRCITEKEQFKKHINKLVCRDVNHPGWVRKHVPILIHDQECTYLYVDIQQSCMNACVRPRIDTWWSFRSARVYCKRTRWLLTNAGCWSLIILPPSLGWLLRSYYFF